MALTDPLHTTPLDALHRRLGARMTGFAGWSLPLCFAGTLAEHAAVRTGAALFDVSHMGQIVLRGPGAAAALERLVAADIAALRPGRQLYTMFLNQAGGVIDDLIVGSVGGELVLVVNAAGTAADLAHLRAALPDVEIEHETGRALLSLQGPVAAAALAPLAPEAVALPFMAVADTLIAGHPARISRSGYTGEDGFEISVADDAAEAVAAALLARPDVVPAGLGARDTLRLEAGLCLYGQDLDTLTTPVEAGLAWTLGKRRLEAGGFPGDVVIRDQMAHGATRRRVGLRLEGRALARAMTELAAPDGTLAGTITSGGFSPTLGVPIAMAYVRRDLAAVGTTLALQIRGQLHEARVVTLPFIPHRYPSRGSHG